MPNVPPEKRGFRRGITHARDRLLEMGDAANDPVERAAYFKAARVIRDEFRPKPKED